MGAERRRCACVEMYRRQHQAISQLKSGLQTNIALCVPHTQCAMRTICWDLGVARKLRGFDRLWGTCDDPIEPGRSYLRGAGKLCTVDGPAQVHTEANNIARSDMGSTRSAPWRTCWEPVYGAAGRGRTRRDRETARQVVHSSRLHAASAFELGGLFWAGAPPDGAPAARSQAASRERNLT